MADNQTQLRWRPRGVTLFRICAMPLAVWLLLVSAVIFNYSHTMLPYRTWDMGGMLDFDPKVMTFIFVVNPYNDLFPWQPPKYDERQFSLSEIVKDPELVEEYSEYKDYPPGTNGRILYETYRATYKWWQWHGREIQRWRAVRITGASIGWIGLLFGCYWLWIAGGWTGSLIRFPRKRVRLSRRINRLTRRVQEVVGRVTVHIRRLIVDHWQLLVVVSLAVAILYTFVVFLIQTFG